MAAVAAGGGAGAAAEVARKRLVVVLHMIRPLPAEFEKLKETAAEDVDKHGPVVAHSLHQARLAFGAGADAAAIIIGDASISEAEVLAASHAVKEAFPDKEIIINFLCDAEHAMRTVPDGFGLWTDRGVDARGVHERCAWAGVARAERAATTGKERVRWYAGFFHKGSDQRIPASEDQLNILVDNVIKLCNVPVTTGAGTGVAADTSAVARLHAAIGGRAPLAIASGVTPENAASYLPYIDDFFVATGIERATVDPETRKFYEEAGMRPVDVGYLDEECVRKLAAIIHGAAPAH